MSLKSNQLAGKGTTFELCSNFSLENAGECESWVPILNTAELKDVSLIMGRYSNPLEVMIL